MARRMHDDELPTDADLVRRLLSAQFPHWAELPLEPLESSGTVNALYRLGSALVVRLPRTDWGEGAAAQELEWLPRLVPMLPVAIPVPLAVGAPAEGYPWEWGVYPWLEGEHPRAGEASEQLAHDLARFVGALRDVQLPGDPPEGRGRPLRHWDEPVRGALVQLRGVIDTDAAEAAWAAALRVPEWTGPPLWHHGDLMPGNLLVVGGRLSGVIDWGGFGVGDPAVDLTGAWNLLSAAERATFRAELDVDDDTWQRGRGWALWTGLLALPYYKETNPVLAENAAYRIGEVLADPI